MYIPREREREMMPMLKMMMSMMMMMMMMMTTTTMMMMAVDVHSGSHISPSANAEVHFVRNLGNHTNPSANYRGGPELPSTSSTTAESLIN